MSVRNPKVFSNINIKGNENKVNVALPANNPKLLISRALKFASLTKNIHKYTSEYVNKTKKDVRKNCDLFRKLTKLIIATMPAMSCKKTNSKLFGTKKPINIIVITCINKARFSS
jgi:hypothetical protein